MRILTTVVVVGLICSSAASELVTQVKPGTGTNVTTALQSEIDKLAAAGGGILRLPVGEYVVASLRLKDGVVLHLDRFAFLYGSTNAADYVRFENPGDTAYATIMAEGAMNVAIEGEGVIDGRGSAHDRVAERHPDGRVRKLVPGRAVLYFRRCRNVRVEGITLRNGSAWTCFFRQCDGVVARAVKIWAHLNYNNDGIDIESRNVLVEDCDIDAEDDSVVVKARDPEFVVENVTVRNCRLSTNAEHFKIGTETLGPIRNVLVERCTMSVNTPITCVPPRYDYPGVETIQNALAAISFYVVDGGSLENVTVREIEIGEGVLTPICVRFGDRKPRLRDGKGFLRNILVEHVRMTAPSASAIPCSISGIPGMRPSNITFRDVDLYFKGGGRAADASVKVSAERPKAYPVITTLGKRLPAYAFYVRHADDILFENVRATVVDGEEARPPIVTDDALVSETNCKWK